MRHVRDEVRGTVARVRGNSARGRGSRRAHADLARHGGRRAPARRRGLVGAGGEERAAREHGADEDEAEDGDDEEGEHLPIRGEYWVT